MPTSHSFPLLDKKEICTRITGFGGPKLSVENLNSPSADVLEPVLDFLVSVAYCGSREESIQPPFQLLGDFFDLYVDAVGTFKSFRRLKKFMTAAGMEDFSVIDLHRPESQRSVRLLSAAINLCMYSNQKMEAISKLNALKDAELAKIEEIREENAKIQQEIDQIEQGRVAQQPQVQALELETSELTARVLALNKQQVDLQAAYNKLKLENNTVSDKIASIEFEIMQTHQEGAHLKSQIVDNPEAVQKTLEEKKHCLMEEETMWKNVVMTKEVWVNKMKTIATVRKKFQKLRSMTQSLEEETGEHNSEKLVKERRLKLKTIEREEWSLKVEREELGVNVERLEEQAEKAERQASAISKAVEAEQLHLDESRARRMVSYQHSAELDKQTEAVQRKIKESLLHQEEKCGQLEQCTQRLMEAALRFPKVV